jgi:hypothetical protein
MAEPRARIVIRDLAKTFREGGREVAAVQDVSVEGPRGGVMVALLSLGVIGIVMAIGIKQLEMRLLRWRPEYRGRA